MSILFLDFYSKLESGSNFRSNFYNTSLSDQFQLLNERLPLNKRYNSLRELVERCFPSGLPKRYYITCPNFKRELMRLNNGIEFLNNVVIRPEKTPNMFTYLPDNMNVILIGDIVSGNKLKSFQVKGIEFIDDAISNFDELVVQCASCYAFERNMWSINHVDYLQSYFTPDIINQLITKHYTVKNPHEVIKMYDEWKKYLDFRYYYLNVQSQRYFEINQYMIKTSYMVDKKTYRKNREMYDDYLLDGHELFTKGEQIILEQQLEDTVSFPLLRVDIDRNKKVFYKQENLKNNKKRTEEEIQLFSFVRENLSLSKTPPIDGDTDDYSNQLRNSFTLGERYKVVKHEIEPDVSDIKSEYKNLIEKSIKTIDRRYSEIKNLELNELTKEMHHRISDEYETQLTEYMDELAKSLDSDVQEFKDEDILQLIQTEIRKIKQNINNEKTKVISQLEKQLKKEKDNDQQQIICGQINDKKTFYEQEIERKTSLIDVRSYYVKRNNQLIENKRNSFNEALVNQVETFKRVKQKEIENKYSEEIARTKATKQLELNNEMKQKISERIENETILRFSIYFKIDEDYINQTQKSLSELKPQYLIYNNRAEKVKIDRQHNALEQFFEGYVKNPYLSTYLFSPADLKDNSYRAENWNWFLDKLNEKQKEAVRKAVSSNGLFLLQGPPGTGKTQVIAEIIGHLIQKGKRVLVSSETHKAIDNVFERMPKIADIRPIRLIPTQNGKESNYGPDKLVDNLYMNISDRMNKTVESYENFYQYKATFSEKLDELKLMAHHVQQASIRTKEIENEIEKVEYHVKRLTDEKELLIDKKDSLELKKESFRRTIKCFDRDRYQIEDEIYYDSIQTFLNEIQTDLNNMKYFKTDDVIMLVTAINQIDINDVMTEISLLSNEDGHLELEAQRDKIGVQIRDCFDEFGEKIPSKEEELKNLQRQLKDIINKINNDNSTIDLSDIKLAKIIPLSKLKDKLFLAQLPVMIEGLKDRMRELKDKQVNILFNHIDLITRDIKGLEEELLLSNRQIKELVNKINDLRESSSYSEYKKYETKLSISISEFFKTFDIVKDYQSNDEAIQIIESEWEDLEKNFESKEKENKLKIPMYKKISRYLRNSDVIEADKIHYTKALFDKVNLYGVTTSSRDNFTEKSNVALSKYNLGNIDLKKQGIDVVIIDEVSKSSFLELLIPILYGKTVILVGDHRQLSPMYEYRNFRPDDFDGLDPEIINPAINAKYTTLYEECFFKTLFETIHDDYKVRLTKQYRSHEQIMNVFNHFYNKTLELGEPSQNKSKQHFLNLHANGRTIIDPKKHIYFVDSKSFESRELESTSIQNKGEAEVVIELLKKIDSAYSKNKDWNPTKDNLGNDERMSVGVICTYGDQTRLIKQKSKQQKLTFKNFNKRDDSKLIISTVDDFQGDERDIIIVSMVRNPEKPERSNADFIKQYQRINVAFSRARRLLIIVGNKNYLMNKGVIDLPDVDGRPGMDKLEFPVFREVVDTIERYGKVIDDIDILGGQD